MPIAPAPDLPGLLPIFHALPGAYLLLSPALLIEAVSDDYLTATLTQRDTLVGRHLFEAFPDNPLAPEAHAVRNLRDSLARVLATGQPHEMALQQYDLPDPDHPGQFVERHWLPRNTPVLGAQGQVQHLIHAVANVTERVHADEQLRESQAREQAAYAEANRQREQLHNVFQQAPAMICIFEGPQHVFQFVNPPYQALVGQRQLLGRPIAEAMPELAGQPIFGLLDQVYQTGEPYRANEMLVQLDHDNTRPRDLEQRYYNFIYQARHNLAGAIDGILVFAYDVTPQVLVRQQVQDLNEELAAANEELQATNEEFLLGNAQLLSTQQELQALNEELESRVQERTQAAYIARAVAEQQQQMLERLFMQAPAAICILAGEELRFELVNQPYQQLFPGRALLGHTMPHAFPELISHGVIDTFHRVYQTGQTNEEQAILIPFRRPADGILEDRYFNYIQQPRYDEHGAINGVLVFAFEVTEQVLARQQVQNLNEELATANEELQATNEEFLVNNTQLVHTQRQLQALNEDLETRVQERTQAAERQRARLEGFLMQAPAGISVLDGPDFVYELVNPTYQQLFPGRALQGQPMREALPELANHDLYAMMRRVYETGVTNAQQDLLVPVARATDGVLEDRYFNFIQQARHDEQGRIDGILVFGFEVTEQVQNRQRVQNLNEELAAANDELQATNEEFLVNNTQLTEAQLQLQELNQQLESRVQERTQQVEAALHEAQQQREQLRVQQGLLRQIIGQVPASIATLTGPDHRYTFFNDGYQALSSDRTVLGHTVAEVFPEVVAQGFVDLLDQVYATGQPFKGTEMPAHLYDPTTGRPEQRYVDFIYQPLLDSQDHTQGILAFIVDVTTQVLARQRADGLQAAQQAQLADLFEQAPVAIAVFTGPDYTIEVANPPVAALWGRQPAQLVGRPLFEALPEMHDQGFKELLDKVVERGEAFVAQEVMALLERQGQLETVYLNFVYQPLRDTQGHITSVAVVATDVSAQVLARRKIAQANDELQMANLQLTRTNVDLDNFIYTASHDLKAPIANIEGLVHALHEHLPAEAQSVEMVPSLLGMMQGAVERFQLTIAQLTDISKLQQAHTQPAEAVDLAALVEDVRLDLAPQLAESEAQFTVDVAACPPISFSPKNLRSIVYNLVSNAVKYRYPGRPPVVQVRCHCTDDGTVLDVQDNGLGLSASQQEKLFGMFQRLHDHVEGSGIGLYMVKKIVENVGGSITVRSELGVGTTFSVSFPS